jgi:hypothetical protein
MPQNEHRVAGIPRLQLTFEETASALSIPVGTLELLERRGESPVFFKLGRRKYTTVGLIKEWQDARVERARSDEFLT